MMDNLTDYAGFGLVEGAGRTLPLASYADPVWDQGFQDGSSGSICWPS
jgi:hypothetical protein